MIIVFKFLISICAEKSPVKRKMLLNILACCRFLSLFSILHLLSQCQKNELAIKGAGSHHSNVNNLMQIQFAQREIEIVK